MSNYEKLVSMGFMPQRVQEIVTLLQGRPIEEMANWLIENPDDTDRESFGSAEAQASSDEFDDYFSEIREQEASKVATGVSPSKLGLTPVINEVLSKEYPAAMDVLQCSSDTLPADSSTSQMDAASVVLDSDQSSVDGKPTTVASGDSEDIQLMAQKFKCLECNKIFQKDGLKLHALKTKHELFQETVEEYKPLTETEKKEAVKKLEDKIKQRRLDQQAREKREAIEKEKLRRKHGQEMALARAKYLEEELKREAEIRRREKMEKNKERERIRAEIKNDQEQRKKEKEGIVKEVEKEKSPKPEEPRKQAEPMRYDTCRLQIRLTNGQVLNNIFNASEPLAAVRLFIELNRTDGDAPFVMLQNFPHRVFMNEDMELPLSTLDLCPNAVIIIQRKIA